MVAVSQNRRRPVKTCVADHSVPEFHSAVEHNAHNLKIAGYTASEHMRAIAAADP
jgi:hypothetical protein